MKGTQNLCEHHWRIYGTSVLPILEFFWHYCCSCSGWKAEGQVFEEILHARERGMICISHFIWICPTQSPVSCPHKSLKTVFQRTFPLFWHLADDPVVWVVVWEMEKTASLVGCSMEANCANGGIGKEFVAENAQKPRICPRKLDASSLTMSKWKNWDSNRLTNTLWHIWQPLKTFTNCLEKDYSIRMKRWNWGQNVCVCWRWGFHTKWFRFWGMHCIQGTCGTEDVCSGGFCNDGQGNVWYLFGW